MREANDSAVLVLAPTGKDGALAAATLAGHGIAASVCGTLSELARRADESTNALLIAQEALVVSEVPHLLEKLREQPPWSDLPVILLTSSGGSEEIILRALRLFGPSANVTLLERPFRVSTLISTVQVALRARRRQREVRELLSQREAVLNSISDAFSALDSDWRYIYLNERVAEHAGLRREEMLGRKIWEILPQLVGTAFQQRCERAMETKTADHFEYFHPHWDRWFEARIYPSAEGLVVFRTDISDRKLQERLMRESEQRLQENEFRLRLALEAADAGTFDYLPATDTLKWSTRCKELFGLNPEAEVTFDTFLRGLHPDDRDRIAGLVQQTLGPASDGRFDVEYRTVGIEDGVERWVAARGLVLFDEQGAAARFIGTVLDITQQKKNETDLQRAKRTAEDANRAKDQFLAMLSHELRTPLTPVLLTIATLRRHDDLPEEVQEDLAMLQRNVELEALLIDDLLDVTRIAHGKLELHSREVDLHALIDHALSISVSDGGGAELKIVRHFTARHAHTWGDAARLQQVIWNLIKNAVKFTPPGGRLEISTRNPVPGKIEMVLRDTGVGIDADLLPRVFEAFQQGGRNVTSRFGGLGLGLAISKRVIDLHHGTITAASDGPGKGATFTVTLDAMETSLLDGQVNLPAERSCAPMAAEILLVEDHQDTRRILHRMLTKAGYTVSLAGTTKAARALAEEKRFDLVISDVGLPDGTGLELMQHLASRYQLRGIALSGFGTDEDRAASMRAGFDEHLTKPVDWERLKEAVAQLATSR